MSWFDRFPETSRRQAAVQLLLASGWNWDGKNWVHQSPPQSFLPNGTRVVWRNINGTEFPATITAFNPESYDARLDDGCDVNGFDRLRFTVKA